MHPIYVYGTINHLPTREAALARIDKGGIYIVIPYNEDMGVVLVRCGERPLHKDQHAFIVQPHHELIDTRDKE